MRIFYRNRKLQGLCENSRKAAQKLGPDSARQLRARLSDIEAAANVAELPRIGAPHALAGDRRGQVAMRLAGGKRLVFEPSQDPAPKKEDGGIDWARVAAITIVEIGDYHD